MVGFLKKRISSRSESPTGGRSLVSGAQDSDDDLPLQGNNPTSSSSIGTNNHTLTSTSSFTNGSTSNENEKIKLKKKKKKKKKKKSEFHIFGEPLDLQIKSLKTTVLIDEEEGIKVIYPKIFWECIKYLENNEFTLETEGIFRISGHASTLQQVKQDFIKGKYDNHLERNVPEEFEEDSDEEDNDKDNVTDIFHQIILNYFNYSNQINVTPINFDELFPQNRIHNVASLLKMYFRELVEPIMTFDHYDMFIASDGIPDEEVRLQVIKNVLRFLPRCNYFILRRICKFLYAIHEKKQLNKMDANNLAIVFAPNILRPPPMYNVIQTQLAEAGFANGLTQSLIRHFHFFFDQEDILQQTKVVQEEFFSHYASNSNSNNNNRKGSVESKEEKKKKEEKKSEPLIVVSSSPVTTSTTTNNATNNATTSINATNNNHITKGSVNNNSIGEDDLVPSTSSLLYNQHSKQLVEEKKRTFSKITNKPLPPPQKQNLSAFIPPIPPRKTTGNVSNNNSNNTNNNAIENTLNNAGDAKEATTLIRRLSNRIKAGDVSDLDKLNGCDDIGSASGMVMQFKTKQRPPLPVPNNNATNNNGVIKRTDSNLTEHPQEKQQMISVTNQIEESITVNVNNRNTNNLPSIPPRFQKKDNIKSAPTPTCENELPSQLVTSSKNSPPPIKPRMTVFVGGTTTTTGTNGGSNNSNNHSQSTPTPPPRSGTVFVSGNNNKASSVTTNTTTSSSNSCNPTPPPKTSSTNAGNSVLKNNPFIVNDHTTKKASPPPYPPPKRQ